MSNVRGGNPRDSVAKNQEWSIVWEYRKSTDSEARVEAAFDMLFEGILDDLPISGDKIP
jgi:hypothetical protein